MLISSTLPSPREQPRDRGAAHDASERWSGRPVACSMIRAMALVACALVCALWPARPGLAQVPTTEPAVSGPEPVERWLLMDRLQDTPVGRGLASIGTQIYGWIQQGFAGNVESPRDRVNFGTNY